MRKLLKIILIIIAAILAAALLFLGFLSVREYKPDDVMPVEISGEASKKTVPAGESLSILTWNIGYGALGKDADFVMDGGGNAPAADEATVTANINGISSLIDSLNPNFTILQEVDSDSDRSYNKDMRPLLERGNSSYALNYSCDFVPFPWPPFGKINSGVFTTTDCAITSADRYSLPCPFSWPLRIANLKRCMLVSRFDVEDSEKELVIVNFHLEAYDDGEGKIAQTKMLLDFIESEVKKGNYVIAGGDWNQAMPGTIEKYPNTHEELWTIGTVDYESMEGICTLAYDDSTPTCRLLNQPYNPQDTENTQYYVIDGFVYSSNIQVDTVETIDENFVNSDHNPVLMTFALLPEN